MDLGCPPGKTFLAVTLPLIWPAVAAGWMLAFTLSLDDLVIASFTTGPGATTLPIRIYSEVRLGVKPEINAACTIFMAVVAAAIVAGSLLTLFFSEQPVRNYDDAKKSDTARFGKFFQEMLERGIFLPHSQYEALFVSAAHTDADIDRTIAAAHESLAAP